MDAPKHPGSRIQPVSDKKEQEHPTWPWDMCVLVHWPPRVLCTRDDELADTPGGHSSWTMSSSLREPMRCVSLSPGSWGTGPHDKACPASICAASCPQQPTPASPRQTTATLADPPICQSGHSLHPPVRKGKMRGRDRACTRSKVGGGCWSACRQRFRLRSAAVVELWACRCLGFLRSCAWSVELSSTSIWRRFVRGSTF